MYVVPERMDPISQHMMLYVAQGPVFSQQVLVIPTENDQQRDWFISKLAHPTPEEAMYLTKHDRAGEVSFPWGAPMTAEATIISQVVAELKRATDKHGPFPSCHHGHSVIMEELEELFDEIKANRGNLGPAQREAIQIAAVAIRYVRDLCGRDQQ